MTLEHGLRPNIYVDADLWSVIIHEYAFERPMVKESEHGQTENLRQGP
jgi:hypothetical protein